MSSHTLPEHERSLRVRTEALLATELMDAPTSVVLDRLTRAASRLLRVPVSLVSLVGEHRDVFAGVTDSDNMLQGVRETRSRDSICRHVVESAAPLIISDTSTSEIAQALNTDPAWWVKSYVGVPLATADGVTLGTLCAMDTVPRTWTDAEIESLGDLAFAAAAELNLRISIYNLRSTEARFRAFMDHSPVMAALLDTDGNLEYVNAMFALHFATSVDEAVGRSLATMREPLARRISTQCALVQQSGRSVERTEILTTPDGEERQWLLYTFPVITTSAKRAVGTVVLDLTQRRLLERRSQQAQKLKAIGQLASRTRSTPHRSTSPTTCSSCGKFSVICGGCSMTRAKALAMRPPNSVDLPNVENASPRRQPRIWRRRSRGLLNSRSRACSASPELCTASKRSRILAARTPSTWISMRRWPIPSSSRATSGNSWPCWKPPTTRCFRRFAAFPES